MLKYLSKWGDAPLRNVEKQFDFGKKGVAYYYTTIRQGASACTRICRLERMRRKLFDAELLLKIIKEKKEQATSSTDLLTRERTILNELATTAQDLYGAFLLGKNIGYKRNKVAQKLIELNKSEYEIKEG